MGGIPKNPQFPLRIRPEILDKMRYLGFENSRSANKEIEQACIAHIRSYEAEYGEITDSDLKRMFDSLY